MDNLVPKIREEIAFRKADDGTMTIVSPETDKIITINASATELWELIDGEASVSGMVETFVVRHEKDLDFPGKIGAATHVKQMVTDFHNRELIELLKI